MPPTIVTTQVSVNPDVFEIRDNDRLLGTISRWRFLNEPGLRALTPAGDLIGVFDDWHAAGDAVVAAYNATEV